MGEPIVLTRPIRPLREATPEEAKAMPTDSEWIPFMQRAAEHAQRIAEQWATSEQKMIRGLIWHYRFQTLSNLLYHLRWKLRSRFYLARRWSW